MEQWEIDRITWMYIVTDYSKQKDDVLLIHVRSECCCKLLSYGEKADQCSDKNEVGIQAVKQGGITAY